MGGGKTKSNVKLIDETYDTIEIPIGNESIVLTPEMARIDRFAEITGGTEILNNNKNHLALLGQIKLLRNNLGLSVKQPIIAKNPIILELKNDEDAFTIIPCTQTLLKFGDRIEEDGVHTHMYSNGEIRRDSTYRDVTIDNQLITADMARIFAIQRDLNPNLNVVSCSCPNCQRPHFDLGSQSLNPHNMHTCTDTNCGEVFQTETPVIGNPIIKILNNLVKKYE